MSKKKDEEMNQAEIKELEKDLGILSEETEEAEKAGKGVIEKLSETGIDELEDEDDFEFLIKHNIVNSYEKKYPEAIEKAKLLILKNSKFGNYTTRLADGNLPIYFSIRYGFKAQGKLVIVC